MATNNCQYSTRYCWDAEKVKALIRLRAELSPLFTGKRNASKYAWAVVERELNVPLPLSKIIKKWNNLLQEYKAIKVSEEPKRREWPFFTLMDVYFSDQVNDPSLRLFSSTKTLKESLDESIFEDDPIISSAIAAATSGAFMDIDEILQRQKERRLNENKFREPVEKNFNNSKVTDYSMNVNRSNVITVENKKKIKMQKDDINPSSPKILPEQYDEKVQAEICTGSNFNHQASDSNTIDQYLLSWNNFLGNMSKGFHTLQKDEKMVDVTIAAGGKIFKAHKLVLSVCSPYFQEIFLENPSNHPILLMADVEANHMAGLLNFMYSGQVNVKYEDLPVFLKVAEAMKIKGLHTEKPEGQNLQEIQFSRDEYATDFGCSNLPPNPSPINICGKSLPSAVTKGENARRQSPYPTPNSPQNLEPLIPNMNIVNYEKGVSNAAILKTNASKQIMDHIRYHKIPTKRKTFVHSVDEKMKKEKQNVQEYCENSEKNNAFANNFYRSHMKALSGSKIINKDVLNLTSNGCPIPSQKCLPRHEEDFKNTCHYNQTVFTEIKKDKTASTSSINDDVHSFASKPYEDGNNNICREGSMCEKQFMPMNKDDGYNNDVHKTIDTNAGFNKDNKTKVDSGPDAVQDLCERKPSNNNDDNNNEPTTKTNNENVTKLVIKYADNNNNIFVTSNCNSKLKESSEINLEDEARTKPLQQ